MATMKRVQHSAPINLAPWGLFDDDWLGQAVGGKVTETIIEEFTEYPPDLFLPIEWSGSDGRDGIGGPPVDDPLLIYVDLSLGASSDDNVVWSASFREMVEDMIDMNAHRDTGLVDPEFAEVALKPFAAALTELAAMVLARCPSEETPT